MSNKEAAQTQSDLEKRVADLLFLPYMRVVIPEMDGSFRAEILEFPGCIALGDTKEDALAALEDVADGWIRSMAARGREIPPPMQKQETDR